jgi:hypothetical protein
MLTIGLIVIRSISAKLPSQNRIATKDTR